MDVGVQYFQYSVEYNGQIFLGNVTLDFRGKPPLFIPSTCFQPKSTSNFQVNLETNER